MRLWTTLVAGAALAMAAGGALAQDAALKAAVQADYEANLAAQFEDFHRNPELSGLEVRTSAKLAEQLSALGYQVTTGVGGTGVVAVLENGPGPVVMLRADMDGLPLQEDTGLAYASTARQMDRGVEKPVMHACGHDVHMTSLIGTARQMMARRDNWSGTLVLIGQPAEETGSGARQMIEDGLFTRFPKPDYALAFHVKAGLPAGQIEVPLGIAYSSVNSVDIAVHGVGTHGAYPHRGIDPVVVASQIVMALQTLPSRTVDPLEGAVVTVGSIHGGIKHNIIPDRVDLQLTVRADNAAVRDQLLAGIERVARGTAIAMGVPEDKLPDVVVSPTDQTPPTVNDSALAAEVQKAVIAGLGADTLIEQHRDGMGGEDFAYFMEPQHGVRAVYFNVGGTLPERLSTASGHHSPFFQIAPEPAVVNGTVAMVTAAEMLFAKGAE